jgi:ribose transport system substrate-binding protein
MVATIGVIALTVVSCSSSQNEAGGGASSGKSAGMTNSTSAKLGHPKKVINSILARPKFKAPGPSIDASKVAGKFIYTVPNSSVIPFCGAVDKTLTKTAKRLRLKTKVYTTQGELSDWVQGFRSAINSNADLINAFCGLDLKRIEPQVAQAKKAGIPVVASHTIAIGQHPAKNVTATVYGAYTKAARVLADWVMTATKGHANVMVITSPSTGNSPYMKKAFKQELSKYCSGCSAKYFGVDATDWGTKIDPRVRAELSSHPDINYIVPIYDGMVQYVTPAIVAAGASGRVHVASFNATPSVLDKIRTGNIVTFEVGEDTAWLADAILDQDMRVLLGKPAIKNYVAGMRGFTKKNVRDAGVPAQLGKGYGNAAAKGYAKLWGIS